MVRHLILLIFGLSLACGAPPQPESSGMALGIAATDQYGLSTVWIEVRGDQLQRATVHDGLRLPSPTGPQHLTEIAARAQKTCTAEWAEDCAIHLASVAPASQATAARAALQAAAEAQVGCTSGHTLERVRAATPDGLLLQRLDGGAACAEPGPSYEELTYRALPWGAAAPLPPDVLPALREEIRTSLPEADDSISAQDVVVVTEHAAGVRRQRAAVVVQHDGDSIELSVLLSEAADPTPFEAVLARWPLATDVLTAPGGAVAAVRLGSERLVVVRLGDGAVLWEQAVPGRVVMAESVVPSAVAAWQAAVQ